MATMQTQRPGLALTSGIASTLVMPLLGVPSLIFIAIGKRDFIW